jgi:hypothetical protein
MRSFFSSAGEVSLDTEGRFEMEEIETDPSPSAVQCRESFPLSFIYLILKLQSIYIILLAVVVLLYLLILEQLY